MTSRWPVIGLLVLLATFEARAERRVGVVVGSNRGLPGSRTLRFAEEDALKVHAVLTELGGFVPADLELLLAPTADQVRAAFRRVRSRLEQASPREDTLLLVYFSGHASRDFLELGGSVLGHPELLAFIREAPATLRVGLVDACHSGGLVTPKGGLRGPAFDIDADPGPAARGHVIITSSAADELSQESSEVRGAIFTHHLVSGLRGAADAPPDGRVTLAEAYRHAYALTLVHSLGTVGGGQHPSFDVDLAGRGEIVLTVTRNARSVLVVRGRTAGRLLVLDERGHSVVAEASVRPGHPARVAVRPGRYRLYLLDEGRVATVVLTVADGEERLLWSYEFEQVRLTEAVEKGGLFDERIELTLGVSTTLRRFPLEGGTLGYGASIWVDTGTWTGWRPGVRLAWGTAPDAGASAGYFELGLAAVLSRVFALGRTSPFLSMSAGYEHLFQAAGDEPHHSSAFAWLAGGGMDVAVGPVLLRLDAGVGGRLLQIHGSGWTHRLDVVGTLGAGWRWSQ